MSLPASNISLTYSSPSATPHLSYTPIASPASNQVVIRVHYAAVNPCDIQLWHSPLVGCARFGREGTMGWDYSGTIVAVGDKLKGKWEVGDEVWGICDGPVGSTFFAFAGLGSLQANWHRLPKGHSLNTLPYQIKRQWHVNRAVGLRQKQQQFLSWP